MKFDDTPSREEHRNTAFLWRHKILDALQNMADDVTLDGIIEADETFFAMMICAS